MRKNKVYLINLVMRVILAYAASLTILSCYVSKEFHPALSALYVCIPVVLFSLMRLKVKGLFLFLFGHILTDAIIVLLMPTVLSKVLMGVVMLFLTAISVRYRKNNEGEKENHVYPGMVIVFFVTFAFAGYFENAFAMSASFYLAVMFLVLYTLSASLINSEKFIKDNSESANLPADNIRSLRNMLITMFIILSMALSAVAAYFSKYLTFGMLGQLMIKVLGPLVRFIFSGGVSGPSEDMEPHGEMSMGLNLGLRAHQYNGALLMILKVLGIVAVSIAALVVLYIIICMLYRFAVDLRLGKQEEDKVEYVMPTFGTHTVERIAQSFSLPVWGGSHNDKIRRYYKNYVIKHLDKSFEIKNGMTANEISTACRITNKEITEIYEKARYDKTVCTKEDVDRLKKLIKKENKLD